MKDIIIISDLHLGSNVCRHDKILSFLNSIQAKHTDKLILNGDIFDSLKFDRLNKNHWKIFKKIRKLSDNIEVTWVYGNHDGECEDIAMILGVDFVREIFLFTGNTKIIITHGDQFDAYIEKYPLSAKVADFFYRKIQYCDTIFGNDFYMSGAVKRRSKSFLGAVDTMRKNATDYCKKNKCDIIICGHTHKAEDLTCDENKVRYLNTGCWTDKMCHYVIINEKSIGLKKHE